MSVWGKLSAANLSFSTLVEDVGRGRESAAEKGRHPISNAACNQGSTAHTVQTWYSPPPQAAESTAFPAPGWCRYRWQMRRELHPGLAIRDTSLPLSKSGSPSANPAAPRSTPSINNIASEFQPKSRARARRRDVMTRRSGKSHSVSATILRFC
jgi:hypothetical protein